MMCVCEAVKGIARYNSVFGKVMYFDRQIFRTVTKQCSRKKYFCHFCSTLIDQHKKHTYDKVSGCFGKKALFCCTNLVNGVCKLYEK